MIEKNNQYIADVFFNKAFKGHKVPSDIQKISIKICKSYGIQGIIDPMYICNIIASGLNRQNELTNIKE